MKRLDDPFVLATAGTLAIHLLIAVIGDALLVAFPQTVYKPAPSVQLVDILPPPIVVPPPPPIVEPQPAAQPEPQPAAKPEPMPQRVRPATPPPPTNEPPPPPTNTPPSSDSGGGPVTQMEDIAPAAHGIPVPRGPRQSGTGRGGSGGGTGTGTGTGSSDAPPLPASIATIKTRALPKGDFSYFDASKDYPAEAKALGIEGVIRVRLLVDAEGAVKTATLLNRLGHGLDELALERAKKIQFQPAKDTDDKPVSSVVVWTFTMTLPK